MKLIRRPWFQGMVLLLIGVGVSILAFRNQDLGAIWAEMRKAKPGYLLLAVVLAGVGHYLRALRWSDLLKAAGSDVAAKDTFSALMTGYLVSFAVPRLGEVTRCALLLRSGRVPLMRSAGTVVTERVVDVAMLGVLVMVTFITAAAPLSATLQEKVARPASVALQEKGWLLGVAAIAATLVLLALILLLRSAWGRQRLSMLRSWLGQIRTGATSILRLPSPLRFGLLTIGIWVSYWSGPVCTLLALDMADANMLACSFAMFTTGSIARSIPLPAGSTGPYHYLVSQVLIAFAFGPVEALAAATLNHATQTLFYFVAGVGSVAIASTRRAG